MSAFALLNDSYGAGSPSQKGRKRQFARGRTMAALESASVIESARSTGCCVHRNDGRQVCGPWPRGRQASKLGQ